MVRVCGVFGTWQLMALVASLHQERDERERASEINTIDADPCDDYLILYETAGVPDEFKNVLHDLAAAIWPWKRIVPAFDLVTNERRMPQHRYDLALRSIRERLGLTADAPDELWVCFLTRPAEKALFEAFPRASIILYEDGLMSYLDAPVAALDGEKDRNPLDSLRSGFVSLYETAFPVRRFRRSRWNIDVRHLKRHRRNYHLLTRHFPLPSSLTNAPTCFVEERYALRALRDGSPLLPPPSEFSRAADSDWDGAVTEPETDEAVTEPETDEREAPRALLLGQALSRNGVMSHEEEAAIYRRVVATVLDRGYSIFWKDHPRVERTFFEEMREFADHREGTGRNMVRRLPFSHAFPVEMVAEKLNLSVCIAGTSAALFYLRRFYSLPCYTFARDLSPYLGDADIAMSEIVVREIPSLDELPMAMLS
jgi:hypothetical protein